MASSSGPHSSVTPHISLCRFLYDRRLISIDFVSCALCYAPITDVLAETQISSAIQVIIAIDTAVSD